MSSNEYFPDEIYLWIETVEITDVDTPELHLKHKENRVRWSKSRPPKGKAFRLYRLVE